MAPRNAHRRKRGIEEYLKECDTPEKTIAVILSLIDALTALKEHLERQLRGAPRR